MELVSAQELALQRKRFQHLSDEEFRFMLQQVEGRQRTQDKLPTFASIEDWWYPVRLSCEQCSSELTAKYKARLIEKTLLNKKNTNTFVDLTGGYGVDSFFISENFQQAHYVEQNKDLCRIAAHNFDINRKQICVHNTSAELFLEKVTCEASLTTIFIDPARRSQSGGKVFLLQDCEPNVVELLPQMLLRADRIMIKLSPMLDITAALRSLAIVFEVHIVAVQGEVKEVLLWRYPGCKDGRINAVNILPANAENEAKEQVMDFVLEEEKLANCNLYDAKRWGYLAEPGGYVYEPNAAIIKAGAFKLIAQRYKLVKMAQNTHLYMADKLVADFPGRVWQIIAHNPKDIKDIRASIMTRNYPLSPEQLRKKLKINDSNTHTIIGARLADKPTLFVCKKI